MKKEIIAGKNFSVNTKKDESPDVIDWLNSQSNLSDSIRFLIEQDIKLYGVRNLQQIIPADRGYSFRSDQAYSKAQVEDIESIMKIAEELVASEQNIMTKVKETEELKVSEKIDYNKDNNKDIKAEGVSKDIVDSWA